MFKNRKNIAIILGMIVVVAGIVGFRMIRSNNTPNTIAFGSRIIINNTWGAPPEEKLSSGIYLNKDKTFGWYWDRSDPLAKPGIKGYAPLYPNVKIGGDIGEKPNNKQLPVKVKSISQLTFYVDYNYLTPPSGTYNLAYQMYFADTDKPSKDAIPNIEVMIWIHYTFGQPPNAYKGDFTDGNHNYELYSFIRSDGRLYCAFLMKGQPVFQAQYAVDAKKLLDDLAIDPNWYLFSIHFGNEVVSGAGKIEISKYEVIMNGRGL